MKFDKPIALAADHGGYELKEAIKAHLNELGIAYTDFGTDSTASVDYPDYAAKGCKAVLDGSCALVILCCGTGVGMSMCANKIKGIRACCCSDTFSAEFTRRHNNANALCLGGDAPTVQDMIEYYTEQNEDGEVQKPTSRTVYRWIKDYGYSLDKNSGKILNDTTCDMT